MRVLVTGASGLIGQALCSTLHTKGFMVRAAVRCFSSMFWDEELDLVAVGHANSQTNWSEALARLDCVTHCAARAHVIHENHANALAAYRMVNIASTRRLAKEAAASGIRRLVFLSSIKVNGEQTAPGAPFLFSDAPAPEGPYGISKWEAEQALWRISSRSNLEVVVVRPTLVYGPKIKGNLLRLHQWVTRGIPLPLGAVRNQRSLVGLSNLIDLLLRCAEHPAAAGQTFLASDGYDLSTPQFIRLIAKNMNRTPRLLKVPLTVLKAGGSLFGKQREVERLVDSLQVNIGHTQEKLDWRPPLEVQDGVREMAQWYAGLQDNWVR